MHRTDADGNNGGEFQDGNPGGGIAGTLFDEAWFNAVQEELVNAILTRAGIALVKGTWTQLATAMDQLTILPGGRLTLETGVGVSTSDQTGKTTVYYTPRRHNRVAVYDGTRWLWRTFSELSQATTDATKSPAAVAASKVYDVFVWLDSSTMRATRGPFWSSDTARGTGAGTTELEFFEGRWVNKVAITNGPAARCGLYVGTIRSDASSQINDSLAKRHVWNTYHRTPRVMKAVEATDTWTYTTATLRQANAGAGNQLDYVVGLAEDMVEATVAAVSSNSGTNTQRQVGIGVDSTSADSSLLRPEISGISSAADAAVQHWAVYKGIPGIGRHFLAWLEYSAASGTTTWRGDNGSTFIQSGIAGQVLA